MTIISPDNLVLLRNKGNVDYSCGIVKGIWHMA